MLCVGLAGAPGPVPAQPNDAGPTANTGDLTIDVAAVFVFIGSEPCAGWLPDGIARDEYGFVLTGEDAAGPHWPLERRPCPLETSVPRVIAAGDIRAGSTKRVGFAVGDGSMAVTCIHRVLEAE